MKLTSGQYYDVTTLRFTGWTVGDGTGTDGYNFYDYFPEGIYMGPDAHGIEPEVG